MAIYTFDSEHRRTLDRYILFLSAFVSTHDKVNLLFARHAKTGHEQTWLPYDSRMNHVTWDQRNLQNLWKNVKALRDQASAYVEALLTFHKEVVAFSAQVPKNSPLDGMDIRQFSLAQSPIWNASIPSTIKGLVYGLGNLFFAGKGDMILLRKVVLDVCQHAHGVRSIHTRAMTHRLCECHAQPLVAAELFRAADLRPDWDIPYSSADPEIMAREYETDVGALFSQMDSLGIWMGGFFDELSLRFDTARTELTQLDNMQTVRHLSVKLGIAQDSAQELLDMLNHLELWLRK